MMLSWSGKIFSVTSKWASLQKLRLPLEQKKFNWQFSQLLAVLAVFGPIGFLQGVVGQFFKEFGLTVCFAMAISLFDALTIAPMMSAYFAGPPHGAPKAKENFVQAPSTKSLKAFDRMQSYLEDKYEVALKWSLKKPGIVLGAATAIFVFVVIAKFIPKTFLPAQDTGEFVVSLRIPPRTNLRSNDSSRF